MGIEYVRFSAVNLHDEFFDSLKNDYAEFEEWFAKKATNMAYVSTNDAGKIDGFLYLKQEEEALTDVNPPLPPTPRLKIGTFKIEAHGTKLGDRFVKKLFDYAVSQGLREIYVTIFPKHDTLITLLTRYGFKPYGNKSTKNGTEDVFLRRVKWSGNDPIENYPLINLTIGRNYLLAIQPRWHTRLLPDSKLLNEGPNVVADLSPTNSIRKVYLAASPNSRMLKSGDVLAIYRMTDGQGPAHYRSVVTSICVVEDKREVTEFATEKSFVDYCGPYSVFTKAELSTFYRTRRYPYIIKFTYNISLPRRVTRKILIERLGVDGQEQWSCIPLTKDQLLGLLTEGHAHEGFVIH